MTALMYLQQRNEYFPIYIKTVFNYLQLPDDYKSAQQTLFLNKKKIFVLRLKKKHG